MRRLVPLTALAAALLGAPSALSAGADTCAAPTVISSLPYADSGTTVAAINDINAVPLTCNNKYTSTQGPDVVYSVTVGPPPNSLTFSLDPTGINWDASIYLLTTCTDGNTCAAGYGADTFGPNGTETISLTNIPAGTYFFYVDSFYSSGNLNSGTYDLTVTGNLGNVPAAPVANDGTLTTAEDMAGTTTLTATDANGDVITYAIVQQPPASEGSVALVGDQATFTPALDFNGTSSFTFSASDPGMLVSNTATVTVTVTPVNDAPIASNQMQSTMEDTAVDVTLMGSDVDMGDTLTYAISMMPPANEGAVTLAGNIATFTPGANFNGTTSFTYHVIDMANAMSSDATVTIDVTAVNDAPTADAQSAVTMEDTPLMLTLTGADVDTGDMLTFAVDMQPPMGEGLVTIAGDMATFTPGPNFNGTTSFTFIASDMANAMSAPAMVTIDVTPVNDAPVADDNAASTPEDTPVDITLTATDVDMGDMVTFEISAQPPAGEGAVTLNGNIATFTPAADFNGQTSFKFRALDSSMTPSTDATVNIMVGALDDPPTFVDPTPSEGSTLSVKAGETLTFTVVATDPDSTPTYSITNAPAASTFDAATGEFSWATVEADIGAYPLTIGAADDMSTIMRNVTLEVTEGGGGAGGGGGAAGAGGAGGEAGGGAGGDGGRAGAGGDTIGADEGCGCVAVGAESGTAGSGLLLGLLALLGIRRRRN
ncbi:MAG: tandem-95 repeat protein [Polyangiaceae bacterium]|nr:tandem-95 repeat protein [Polyangiaceae bacterium]